ncbi:hypothetical protein [Actinoplanes sp. RD1]|uniref:hypothetical protein n=1 Tax=Actinoplanes sp. RD1 TaxID=3064538 RepID=UPI002742185D|nr:hypothetical protein [Actinoplanes sp. RD1]
MRRLATLVAMVTCGLAFAGCADDNATPDADAATSKAPGAEQSAAADSGEAPGAGDNGEAPGAGESGSVPIPGISGIPATDEPPGAIACAMAAAASRAGSFMAPGVVVAIQRASGTADAPVADAAGRLTTAYNAAAGAVGAEDEPDKVAAVSAAAAELVGVCGDSGLETVG